LIQDKLNLIHLSEQTLVFYSRSIIVSVVIEQTFVQK